jgi:hypothetical protein
MSETAGLTSSPREDAEILRDLGELGVRLARAGHDHTWLMEGMKNLKSEDELAWSNMTDVIKNGVDPILPTIGYVDDGRPLFYAGYTNMLYGADGVGKSLIMLHFACQELRNGFEVMWIDYEEDTDRTIGARLQSMHADANWGHRFHVIHLNRSISGGNMKKLIEKAGRCSLVILDSVGEFLGAHGKDSHFDSDIRNTLYEYFGRPIAKTGPAVVFIDHIAKAGDGSSPSGSLRKRAGLSGVAHYVYVPNKEDAWSKETGGYALIETYKDRHGEHPKNGIAAFVECVPQTATQPLRLLMTKQQPADLIMDDAEHEYQSQSEPPKMTVGEKKAAVRDLIESLGVVPTMRHGLDMLREQGIVTSGQVWRETIAELEAERIAKMMAADSDD